jgi:hypothetical protein
LRPRLYSESQRESDLGWEMSSRGRFATPADFPQQNCTEDYMHAATVRALSIYRARAISRRPVRIPTYDSQLLHRCIPAPTCPCPCTAWRWEIIAARPLFSSVRCTSPRVHCTASHTPPPPHQRCPNWGWAEVHKACWAPGVIIAWQRAHTVLPCTLMCLRALSAIAASEVVNCTKPKPLDLRVMLSLTTCLASPSELLASPSALSA